MQDLILRVVKMGKDWEWSASVIDGDVKREIAGGTESCVDNVFESLSTIVAALDRIAAKQVVS